MESYPNPNDDFLQAGGNSVLALQLVSELEEVLGSSAHTSLVGSLLGGSTFEECCAYLSSPCQRELGSSSVVASKQFIEECKCRKRLSNFQRGDSVKHLRLEQVGISTLDSTEIEREDSDENAVLVSRCRGKSEGVGAWTEACVFPTLNSIQLEVRWKYNLGKCVDASPCFLKYKRYDSVCLFTQCVLYTTWSSYL
jgi:hypothetical protein